MASVDFALVRLVCDCTAAIRSVFVSAIIRSCWQMG